MNVLKNGLYKQFVCNHATMEQQQPICKMMWYLQCFSSTYQRVVVSPNKECSYHRLPHESIGSGIIPVCSIPTIHNLTDNDIPAYACMHECFHNIIYTLVLF